ncbi:hypothetical protein GIW54_05365 [Pseudomonas proteolytica]|uniref:Uncharacterized protein n=1 Tax=Pseudomonas proteolytica TaxID=219574 RepID=A0AAW5A395_9PSED|nr:hypothetical protein [Pseudomonas proteolytica]MCF5056869.1 hypothetical protein [Pseudomonas proteolytica]MCF5100190.1 hypothetical protein [Pseudomonas proteolytica]
MSDNQMIIVPRDEVEGLVKLLQYQAHPYPSPHAEFWQSLLDKPLGGSLSELEVSQFLADALTAAGMVRHGKQDKKFAERLASGCVRVRSAWLAEQPAPVAVVLPKRSPKDYAIEHAEYMAKSADDVLAQFQAYGLALLAVDEGGDDGEGELFENVDAARSDLQESLLKLRGMVYEFRKRRDRIARRTGETAQ